MRAIMLAMIGFFSYTLMDLSIKWLVQRYPLPQVMFINAAAALVVLSLWIAPRRQVLKTRIPWLHVLRAALLIVVDALAFYSYQKVPLAHAYPLILMMPIFVGLLAMLFKLEQFDAIRIACVVSGFLGVTMVFMPWSKHPNAALVAATGSAFIEAIIMLLVVRYRHGEHPLSFAFYGMALTVPVMLLMPGWSLTDFTGTALCIGIAGGCCYAVANVLVVSAFQEGSPTTVSSIQYTQLIWGMFLAYVLWGELPSYGAILGGIVIVVAGLMMIRREANQQLLNPYSDNHQH